MKFSKESLATLKNFATINGGIVLKPGAFVMTRSVNGATYAEATLADEIDAEVGIYDLNAFLSILSLADENAEISTRFGIRSIPTVLIYKNGEVANKFLGFKNKEEILSLTK